MNSCRTRMALILTCLIPLGACSLLPAEYQPQKDPVRPPYSGPAFRTVSVERGDLRVIHTFHVSYEPIRQDNLGFQIGGMRLEAIYVEPGDIVQAGDLLAELEGGEDAALLDQRQAALEDLDLRLMQMDEDYARALEKETLWQKALHSDDTTRREALAALETQHAQERRLLEEERELLVMEVEESQERVRTAQIHAPYDGVISYTRSGSVGETVKQGETIVEISDNAISLFVGELGDQATMLTPGTTWEVVSDDIAYPVEMINPTDYGIEPEAGMGYARLTVDNVQLESGTKGTIDILVAESLDTLYLPPKAVFTIGDDQMVYLQNADGLRYAQKVTTGIETTQAIEITSGLEEGDSVVVG